MGLALRLKLVSSLPDSRGLFAVIRVRVVMPERSHQTFIAVYRSLDIVLFRRTPASMANASQHALNATKQTLTMGAPISPICATI